MVMVEQFADTPACAPGDFACALGRADADILARSRPAFADIAGGLAGVKGDKVPGAFPNALGRRSSSFGGSLANVSCASADVAGGAARMGLLLRRML